MKEKELTPITEGLVMHPQKYICKIVYEKDIHLEEYQNALYERMRDRINHPIKWFFKDLFGLTEEIKRKPPKIVVERVEYI